MAKAKEERKEERKRAEKFLPRAPILETSITTSEDGKWFIHKTVITDIKSRKYMEKVLE